MFLVGSGGDPSILHCNATISHSCPWTHMVSSEFLRDVSFLSSLPRPTCGLSFTAHKPHCSFATATAESQSAPSSWRVSALTSASGLALERVQISPSFQNIWLNPGARSWDCHSILPKCARHASTLNTEKQNKDSEGAQQQPCDPSRKLHRKLLSLPWRRNAPCPLILGATGPTQNTSGYWTKYTAI